MRLNAFFTYSVFNVRTLILKSIPAQIRFAVARRIRGALILGILVTTLLAVPIGRLSVHG